ncbi:hypothetical protein NU294_20880, partial [Escherichia coli]|nr:hypothetical protein [Escherichia coli]
NIFDRQPSELYWACTRYISQPKDSCIAHFAVTETFASRIRKKTSQIEVKLTVWTMSGKPNGQYGT